MGFLWDFHGISMGFLQWDFLWDFHGISMGFYGISVGFLQCGFSGISMGFLWDLPYDSMGFPYFNMGFYGISWDLPYRIDSMGFHMGYLQCGIG